MLQTPVLTTPVLDLGLSTVCTAMISLTHTESFGPVQRRFYTTTSAADGIQISRFKVAKKTRLRRRNRSSA